MPIDLPDWGPSTGGGPIHQLEDMGELAVRLGSIVTFDRRGDVMWLDGFEDGLEKWIENPIGSGASIGLSDEHKRNGKYSVHLIAGTSKTHEALIQHYHPYTQLSRFGLEYSFRLPSTIEAIWNDLRVFDGTRRVIYTVRWRDAENDLQYVNADGYYVPFATGVDLYAYQTLFHTWKMVVDSVTGKYVRLILDDREFDLSAYSAQASSLVSPRHMILGPSVIGRTTANDEAFVDDVILTQNEPANV